MNDEFEDFNEVKRIEKPQFKKNKVNVSEFEIKDIAELINNKTQYALEKIFQFRDLVDFYTTFDYDEKFKVKNPDRELPTLGEALQKLTNKVTDVSDSKDKLVREFEGILQNNVFNYKAMQIKEKLEGFNKDSSNIKLGLEVLIKNFRKLIKEDKINEGTLIFIENNKFKINRADQIKIIRDLNYLY